MRIDPTLLLGLALAGLLGGLSARLLDPAPVAASPQSADAGSRYVAAVGPYQDGVSLLYVLDQETQRLAVYEARGGAKNSHRVEFVGARNISLDSLLDGFNDESEFSYQTLRKDFEKAGHDLAVPSKD
ncbi:MAG: hypothetical protein O3A20_02265 [Planctomycetota bacterium]|nr:hypothetical protein [Planctomycetota bacterium]